MPLFQQLWGCHVYSHGPALLPHLPDELCEGRRAGHFDTHNNLAGTCLHHCICCATLQFTEDDANQCREYSRSQLILPRGAQHKEWLFPEILKPQNHWGPLTDPANEEPYPMELVGDFQVTDPIFKGCYGYSLLYTGRELHQLRWQGIHLPLYWGEIPTLLAPSYLQARQPKVMKQSPPRAATPSLPVESPKTKHSGGKGGPTMAQDAAPTRPLQSTPTLLPPRSLQVPRGQPQVSRRCLPGLVALTSMAVPLPHLLSQLDANGKMSTQRATTQPFPSAPVPLTASAVQWNPTVMELSFCLPPSPRLPWVLVVPDSGEPCLTK